MPTLTIYGKPGCHVCGEALVALEGVRRERPFVLEQVDVTRDPAMNSRYGDRVPVVELDGEPVFELFVDADALRRRLDAVS